MGFKITFAKHTDVGDRDNNEDSIAVFSNGENCGCILCDGLGGMGMGDVASKLVVDVFENIFMKTDDVSGFLDKAFPAGQDVLLSEQERLHAKSKMKTTGVSVVMDKKNAYIGHIGDSRLYIFKKNKIVKRTLDHSIPQMLALTGEIKESEIRHHKKRSIILRTLGIEWEEPMYELMKPIPLKKCDAFLLCSDGVWELIEDEEMCQLLKEAATPEEWLQKISVLIKMRGKGNNMDNNSAIAVWIER